MPEPTTICIFRGEDPYLGLLRVEEPGESSPNRT
jgi:hypothetical protein